MTVIDHVAVLPEHHPSLLPLMKKASMPAPRSRQLFANLPVRDLQRSQEFFSRRGFAFNPDFTDDNDACLILSEEAFVMLLTEPFFRSFTRREPCDTSRYTEALFALSCESREEVDELVNRAVQAGGSHVMEPLDRGFMYGWSFYDPDGHHGEVMWMDQSGATEVGGFNRP